MDNLNLIRDFTEDLKLLYIEDDPLASEEMLSILDNYFDQIVLVTDGKKALEAYEESDFDIVLADINLPYISGLEVAREMKLINPEQSIIFISGNSDSKHIIESIEIGAAGYILKPIDVNQVISRIIDVSKNITAQKRVNEYHSKLESLVEKQRDTISEQSRLLAEKLRTDILTGANNVFVLFEDLKNGDEKMVFLLNINHFSNINDIYGFPVGDEVLKSIKLLLDRLIHKDSKLYRLDSDQFVIVSDNLDIKYASFFANTLLSFFNETTISASDLELKLTFSIGIDHGCTNEVINNAKVALLDSRKSGRNNFKFFDKNSEVLKQQERMSMWMHKIQDAIHEDELVPYFQPIVNNTTGEVEKYECLARIIKDDEVHIPFEFIKVAEKIGLLSSITKNIINKSCKNFKDTKFDFSINITSHDLLQDYLQRYLTIKCDHYGIDHSRVVLEVLEDITSLKDDLMCEQLGKLKEAGFKIAIDDFGSESSNFSRLLEISPDYIKIDGSFIKDIVTDKKSLLIVKTITAFAKESGIKVIAEYVHNEQTFNLVKELGIEYSQGYFFSAPKIAI